ncbi:MAG: nitroreductase [Phycisphaerales bacterium]|nr:nitroreductase [Phycisphaerales bacterium]
MDVYEAIRKRRSIRAYANRPITDATMCKLRQVLRFAPSACNYQPWYFIFVTDSGLRRKIGELCNGQLFVSDAPVIVVACGYPEHAYKRMGGYGNSVDMDLAIAVDHLTLAATAEGLGTCWIGAFDEQNIKKLMNIPEKVKVVTLIPIGYPADEGMIRPVDESLRKPETEIFGRDSFGHPLG